VQSTDPHEAPDVAFTYIDIGSIDNLHNRIVEPKVVLGRDAPSRARQVVKANDVLFSTVRTYLKNIAAVDASLDEQVASTGFCVLRPLIDPRFVYHYVLSQGFLGMLEPLQRGTSYPAVRDGDLFAQPIPVPPLDEQERIVTRIEELMSDVEAGAADSESAARLIGRCRQAARNHLTLGGVSRGLDAEGKPVLPEGWEWSTVRGVSEFVQYGTSDKADLAVTEVPVLRMGNIKDGVLVTDDLKFMPDGWACVDEFSLEPGDILFTRTNGNPALVGKSAVYRGVPENAVFASYLIRVRLDAAKAVPEFVIHCLNSAFGRAYIASVVSQVGQANVNGSKLKRFPIPLPPLDEQARLAEQADDLLHALDAIQADVSRSLKRAESLRQSILKSAFSGQLV
jgi:type I restriction enzyme S subunit